MKLLQAALQIISGELKVVNETNDKKYLSDGSSFNKKELNKFVSVMNCYMYHERDSNQHIELMNYLVHCKVKERAAALDAELKSIVVSQPIAASAPKKVVDKDWLTLPRATNKRFICGYDYTDEANPEFVMVFWNSLKDIPNSHGDLEQYYKENHSRQFEAVSGGFFITKHHNDATPEGNSVYLFGRSSTYRSFEIEIDEIRAYGMKHQIDFIIGKTYFEHGERTDIVKEYFTDTYLKGS